MAPLSERNRRALFSPRNAGEEVLLLPGTPAQRRVFAQFSTPTTHAEAGEAAVTVPVPQIMLCTTDAGEMVRGDAVEVHGERYVVSDRLDDGDGLTILPLYLV